MIKCNQCGAILHELPNTPMDQRKPCPTVGCGSLSRLVALDPLCVESVVMPSIKGKTRHGQPGEVRPHLQFKTEDGIYRKTGERTFREKIEDRQNDLYRETVTSQEMGKIIHRCEEPLRDHQEHGSGKKS